MKIKKEESNKDQLIRQAAKQWVNILFMQIYAKRQKRIEDNKIININSPIKII